MIFFVLAKTTVNPFGDTVKILRRDKYILRLLLPPAENPIYCQHIVETSRILSLLAQPSVSPVSRILEHIEHIELQSAPKWHPLQPAMRPALRSCSKG